MHGMNSWKDNQLSNGGVYILSDSSILWSLLISSDFVHLNSHWLPVWASLASDYYIFGIKWVWSFFSRIQHQQALQPSKGWHCWIFAVSQMHALTWTHILWNWTMLNSWNRSQGQGRVSQRWGGFSWDDIFLADDEWTTLQLNCRST